MALFLKQTARRTMVKQETLDAVADKMIETAHGIRSEDFYADHVTEEQKNDYLARDLKYAEEVRKGVHNGNLTIAQRIRYHETGECVAILPK